MTTITRRVMFEAVDQVSPTGQPFRVPVVLSSTSNEPHDVHLYFKAPVPVRWPLTRNLLIDGLIAPHSIRDVQVGPDPHDSRWILFTLSPPHQHAQFRIRRRTLLTFLADTVHHVDLMSEIDEWLRESA